jgi:predicted metal-dependent HD superfamily phosphohydrolase
MANSELRQAWHDLVRAWSVDFTLADLSFEEIVEAYSAPERVYHTLEHIVHMLSTVESLAAHAAHLSSVRLATWLHDVAYDPKAPDNEERSAQVALDLCEELAIPVGQKVAGLIQTTKTHDAGNDIDAQILLDADLAILGAPEPAYHAYAEGIRREYAWVPEAEYRQERRRILGSFLVQPRIYYFLAQLEQPARRNMAAEIARLSLF